MFDSFETLPCSVCGANDFLESNATGSLICNVCGHVETANQILELEVDDALAINSMNRSAIVRISQSQAVAVSRAKVQPDKRTARDFLEILGKIGNALAEDLDVSGRFRPLWDRYLTVLDSRKFLVSQTAHADNIFLFDRKSQEISDHKISRRDLRRRLEVSGFPAHLVYRLRKSEILKLLEISDSSNTFLPAPPSFRVVLALLEISSYSEISFPADFPRTRMFSLVPLCEEISDFYVEATHGKYRSLIREEKFPTRPEIDEAKYSLFAAGICGESEISRDALELIARLGGGEEARKFFVLLQEKKMFMKKRHKAKFRDLIHSLTGNFALKHSTTSVHRKSFALRDAPVIGNFLWSLEKICAVVVAAETLSSKKFPSIPNLEISLCEYLATSESSRSALLEYCRSEIFCHANDSVFEDLVFALDSEAPASAEFPSAEVTNFRSAEQVPLVFWHPKKPRPERLPAPWSRQLRHLSMQTGISERQIHNGAVRLVTEFGAGAASGRSSGGGRLRGRGRGRRQQQRAAARAAAILVQ